MSAPHKVTDEQIQDMLDGRLPDVEREMVESAMKEHAEVLEAVEAVRLARDLVRRDIGAPAMPQDLREKVTATLDEEDHRAASISAPASPIPWAARPILAWAAVLLIGLGIGFYINRPNLLGALADDFAQAKAGELSLQFSAEDPQVVEQFMADHEMPFHEAMLDLGSERFVFDGGLVQTLDRRPSALFCFHREADNVVVCQMRPGNLDELPAGGEVYEEGVALVIVYRRDDLTFAFWQDGGFVCVLTSDMDEGQLISMAMSKAGGRGAG